MITVVVSDSAVVTEALVVVAPGLILVDIADSLEAADTLLQARLVVPLITAGVIPSGAAYVDLVEEDLASSTPALLNVIPSDGQDDIPASDKDGSHPFHITIVDPGGTGLDISATTIDLTVNKTDLTQESLAGSSVSVSEVGRRTDVVIVERVQLDESLVVDVTGVKDVVISDRLVAEDRVLSGLQERVYGGGVFAPDWAAASLLASVASDGIPPVDEMRFKLIRDHAFKSLERVTIDVHAEVL